MYVIVQARTGLYWDCGAWTTDKSSAVQFENAERQYVRLSPGEAWEKV